MKRLIADNHNLSTVVLMFTLALPYLLLIDKYSRTEPPSLLVAKGVVGIVASLIIAGTVVHRVRMHYPVNAGDLSYQLRNIIASMRGHNRQLEPSTAVKILEATRSPLVAEALGIVNRCIDSETNRWDRRQVQDSVIELNKIIVQSLSLERTRS